MGKTGCTVPSGVYLSVYRTWHVLRLSLSDLVLGGDALALCVLADCLRLILYRSVVCILYSLLQKRLVLVRNRVLLYLRVARCTSGYNNIAI